MKIVNLIHFRAILSLSISVVGLCYGDSFNNNFYNNHGVAGLINTPTARFLMDMALLVYDGTPGSKDNPQLKPI